MNTIKKALLLFAAAASATAIFAADTPKTNLSKLYVNDFLIGVALPHQVTSLPKSDRAKLAASQFNSITPEDCLKWDVIQPQEGKFFFGLADDLVDFAQKNKMKIHGHALIWPTETPDWVFQKANGGHASREEVLDRMKTYIEEVMLHFKGKIQIWEVVSDAFNDDGTLRDSLWRRTVGDDYIVRAFEFAHAADPSAKLVYNDCDSYNPAKHLSIVLLLRELKSRGLIHAVGIQGHWSLDYPDTNKIGEYIREYASMGLKVLITEMDIDVLPTPPGYHPLPDSTMPFKIPNSPTYIKDYQYEYQQRYDPYSKSGLPDRISRLLAVRYSSLFKLFLTMSNTIYSVTFWGLDDGSSWLNNYPDPGRTNYPLLFDRQLKAKPCYDAIVEVKQSNKK